MDASTVKQADSKFCVYVNHVRRKAIVHHADCSFVQVHGKPPDAKHFYRWFSAEDDAESFAKSIYPVQNQDRRCNHCFKRKRNQ